MPHLLVLILDVENYNFYIFRTVSYIQCSLDLDPVQSSLLSSFWLKWTPWEPGLFWIISYKYLVSFWKKAEEYDCLPD